MKRIGSFLLGALLAAPLAAADPPQVGDKAPDFEMVGSDGKTYKLSELTKAGKAVVLAWFPKAFTGGCTAECKSLKAEGDNLRQFDVVYFTASCDPVERNKEFAQSLGVDYPILSDPDGKVATAYGNYNPTSKIAARWTFYIGADGTILHIDKAVKAANHGADIAAKLTELGVAKKK